MKIIGIVGRAYQNKDGEKIFQVNEAIRRVFSNDSDIIPFLILPTNYTIYSDLEMGKDQIMDEDKQKLDAILSVCDGIVVPGGVNWYQFDEYIIRYAIEKDLPLLAICAGFQALCSIYADPRTKFDMTKTFDTNLHYKDKTTYQHSILIQSNTKLSNLLQQDKILVNSLHHDYIDIPLKELTIAAVSEDGIIEAVELSNKTFVLGLQWHPEYLMDSCSQKILNSFIAHVKNTHFTN